MLRLIRLSSMAVLLTAAWFGGRARAENEGQDDLDRATEAKLIAKSASDLDEVIELCESALEKGLDEGNTQFANVLLVATLVERGSWRAHLFFSGAAPGGTSAQLRKDALSDLERAVKLDPQQGRAFFFIARIHRIPGGDPRRAVEAIHEAVDGLDGEPALRAKALMLRSGIERDPDKKMADLDEAVRISPGDGAPRYVRGLLLAAGSKFDAALADFDKAIELAPKFPGNHEAKAIVFVRLKKYDQALASLDRAAELAPKSVNPLMQKAQIHVIQKMLDAALADLDQAHTIQGENTAVLLARARVHQASGDTDKALADVDAVLKLKPDYSAAMRLRVLLLGSAQRRQEAIAELEELRKLAPKDVSILLQLGIFYSMEKKYGRAVKALTAALAERPDSGAALSLRGGALLNLGEHRRAAADYDKALKLQPKSPLLLNNLAWMLATSPDDDLRDGRRAVELSTEACELTERKEAHILSTLGAAYAETGDFATAIKWVEKGLEVAEEDEKEPLGKELESYRAEKPWRERFTAENPAP